MEKNRYNRRRRTWNEPRKNTSSNSERPSTEKNKKFHFISHDSVEEQQKKEKAIKDLKSREVICPKCGERISDVASAICEKSSGIPLHFECALKQVSDAESVGQNEKIAYIGQGRFAVLYYENIREQKNFKIKKIIEWEDRDSKPEWRAELSSLYSQVE